MAEPDPPDTPMSEDDDDNVFGLRSHTNMANMFHQMCLPNQQLGHFSLKSITNLESYPRIMDMSVHHLDDNFDVVSVIMCPPPARQTFPIPEVQPFPINCIINTSSSNFQGPLQKPELDHSLLPFSSVPFSSAAEYLVSSNPSNYQRVAQPGGGQTIKTKPMLPSPMQYIPNLSSMFYATSFAAVISENTDLLHQLRIADTQDDYDIALQNLTNNTRDALRTNSGGILPTSQMNTISTECGIDFTELPPDTVIQAKMSVSYGKFSKVRDLFHSVELPDMGGSISNFHKAVFMALIMFALGSGVDNHDRNECAFLHEHIKFNTIQRIKHRQATKPVGESFVIKVEILPKLAVIILNQVAARRPIDVSYDHFNALFTNNVFPNMTFCNIARKTLKALNADAMSIPTLDLFSKGKPKAKKESQKPNATEQADLDGLFG